MSETVTEKIKRIWEAERRDKPLARDLSQVPVSYEALTCEWLSEALCKGNPAAKVVSFRLGVPDNGTSNRRRIYLSYNNAGKLLNLPPTVFCKSMQGLPNRLMHGYLDVARSEPTFFNIIRPELAIVAPNAYYAGYDSESYNYLIVMEDLVDVEFCDHQTIIHYAAAKQMVELLGILHRQYLGKVAPHDARLNLTSWVEFSERWKEMGWAEAAMAGFERAGEVIPRRLQERSHEIWPATLRSIEAHKHLPHTIIHCDPHLKNWYRTKQGIMGLNDWQATCVGHWSRDLAYALSCALRPEDRRAWETDLITNYLKTFTEAGISTPSLKEAINLYKQQLFGALAFWTVTLTPPSEVPQEMQPVDVTLEFIRRIAIAIDDLGALDSASS